MKLSIYNALATLLTLYFLISNMHSCSSARLLGSNQEPNTTNFIKTSCGVTMYQKLCIESLSGYATTIQTSPKQLVNAALSVSLTSARSTVSMVVKLSKEPGMKPREAAAVKDCVENVGDSVDELQQSLAEMSHMKGKQDVDRIGNVQTWVSAALTNEDTCMDGFEGKGVNGNVKSKIRGSILSVAKLTSNALALIDSFSNLETTLKVF